jgi:WD40 repeat protein
MEMELKFEERRDPRVIMVVGEDAASRLRSEEVNLTKMSDWHSRPITGIAVLHDGRVVTASEDKTLRVWVCPFKVGEPPKCVFILEGHTDAVTGVKASHAGGIVSCSRDKTIGVWHMHPELQESVKLAKGRRVEIPRVQLRD